MVKIIPRSLFGRLVLILSVGLILAQVLSAFILLRDRGQVLYEAMRENLIERTADIVHLLNRLPKQDRLALIPVLSSPEMKIRITAQPLQLPEQDSESIFASKLVREQLLRRLSDTTEVRVSVEGSVMEAPAGPMRMRRMMEGGRMAGPWAFMHGLHAMARHFHIQVALRDGTWVSFERAVSEQQFYWPVKLLIVLGILLLSVIVLSLIGVRTIIRPLHDLKQAAEGLGRDIRQPPLALTGPIEVRDTARAFNTMQARLKNYIDDRAGILAAVSHDLKTPLTRLRLRAELIEDDELRSKTEKDLDDMEAMVTATMDFMRGTETAEASQPLDLMALLESIQDDAQVEGKPVSLQEAKVTPYKGKPLAIKRCLVNLIDNAVRYGQEADIRIADSETAVVITICDKGPGIPVELQSKVFDPFFRLEGSRAKHTGGTGLGLGIARNIARAHGGDLVLRNRAEGGLCVRLTLPR